MADGAVQVITTIDSEAAAEALAQELVEKRLAGCVQISGPIRSVYRWKGEIEKAEEWVLVVKTNLAAYRRLEAAIREVHPYDTPEILAVPVVAGSRQYLEWLEEAVGDGR